MDKQTFFRLLDKYREGSASPAEKALVEAYYRRLEMAGQTELSPEEENALKETIYAQVAAGIRHQEAKVIQVKQKRFLWTAAAALVLLALGAGSYYLFFNTKPAGQQQAPLAQEKPCDLPPARQTATLTLADGKTIVLDSSSGTISTQGGVTVINMSGLLSYASAQKAATASQPVYNTVTTARGNQYQLVLADGSKVWLNSASSLRFPTVFTGPSREVELNGEGYFEVEDDPSQPFIVTMGTGGRVEVLGTHFNVNCYHDEESVRTTLLEGKVRVVNRESAIGSESAVLKPGEQAILTHDSRLTIAVTADVSAVTAWKNGWFEFEHTDLKTIMRQISRWYDVDIVYAQMPGNEKFGGRISRKENLSTILKALESEELQFRLEGKKLIIQ